MGAGLSGIGAGHYLQTECPWADYAIFEARDAIGGTWDLFRYPGIRSDSDMHTLGYSFRPWDGEKSIADGDSILQYIKDTASESGVDTHIRFNHRIIAAELVDARFALAHHRRADGHRRDHRTHRLASSSPAAGTTATTTATCPTSRAWRDFAGTIVHPQAWPEGLDFAGKRIVVIGSGATAVTLVPALARSASHVTMLQRSPTYIASLPEKSPVVAAAAQGPAGATGRDSSEVVPRHPHPGLLRGEPEVSEAGPADARQGPGAPTSPRLRHRHPLHAPLRPVGPALLRRARTATSSRPCPPARHRWSPTRSSALPRRASCSRRASELEADIIVTATGLELLFLGGIALSVDGERVDPATRLTYKGMMIEGVPNMALAIGYTNASWTLKCDLTCDYVCRLLNYMHERGADPVRAAQPATPPPRPGPILGLTSGYIQRSAHLLPKQGTKYPWKVHQSYWRDYRALKMSDIDDSIMEFSGPRAPVKALEPVGVLSGTRRLP